MTKSILTVTIFLFCTSLSNADFLRVDGGIGAWGTKPTGKIAYIGNNEFDVVDQAGLESSTSLYAWINFKHPMPFVPNFRFEYVDPEFDGEVTRLEWRGNTYASVNNTLSLTQYDVTLFYNLLDETLWTTLDLGLNVKIIDGNYELSESTGFTPAVDESFSLTMPLAYIRTRLDVPGIDVGIEGIAKGMAYSGNTVIDAQIKIDYTMNFIPVIKPGLELGYRYQKMKLDTGSIGLDANIDTEFSGVYGGVVFRF
ncbi:MAG: TIGR04219 family outer membrane beta-barrel protein [Methylococcaceae bacterium]|nr:TIGR04219 family outer membrane beta-barrel protein [Methylococcaceae bacterium]